MAQSKIEWTNWSWNPTVGCSVTSPGCTNCYAMRMAGRLEAMGSPIYRGHTIKTKTGYVWNGNVGASNHGQMIKPLSWKKPRRIFVNSMSDLFHEDMPDDVIDQVFAVMALCQQHTFQVLTKRSARMREYLSAREIQNRWMRVAPPKTANPDVRWKTPLPNVWLGVSVEDQDRANERIPDLIETPARIKFLSCEPLLGPLSFKDVPGFNRVNLSLWNWWVITGGESGPNARPSNPQWFRDIGAQCEVAGVPWFHKQNGEFVSVSEIAGPGAHFSFPDGRTVRRVGKKKAGATIDGREHREMPT